MVKSLFYAEPLTAFIIIRITNISTIKMSSLTCRVKKSHIKLKTQAEKNNLVKLETK